MLIIYRIHFSQSATSPTLPPSHLSVHAPLIESIPGCTSNPAMEVILRQSSCSPIFPFLSSDLTNTPHTTHTQNHHHQPKAKISQTIYTDPLIPAGQRDLSYHSVSLPPAFVLPVRLRIEAAEGKESIWGPHMTSTKSSTNHDDIVTATATATAR